MTRRGERVLRRVLKTTFYLAMEIFISDHVVPEIERNSVQVDRDELLIRGEEIIDRAVNRAITELEYHHITSLDELEDDPQLVESLMDKIQQDMISDAQSLQEN